MTRRSWDSDLGRFTGFYRDRENGWIFGVCAGVADRFNLNVAAVRVIAVVALIVAFWFTAVAYIVASVLIREKPLIYSGQRSESDFWRRYRSDHWRRS